MPSAANSRKIGRGDIALAREDGVNSAEFRLSSAITRIGKAGDQVDLQRYLHSPEFEKLWARVPAKGALRVMEVLSTARHRIAERHPVPQPSNRTAYWTAERVEALRQAHQRYGGEWIRIAISLGVTPGSAELAFRRYVVKGSPPISEEKVAQYAPSRSRPYRHGPKSDSVRRREAGVHAAARQAQPRGSAVQAHVQDRALAAPAQGAAQAAAPMRAVWQQGQSAGCHGGAPQGGAQGQQRPVP